jgi:hypothetical protein
VEVCAWADSGEVPATTLAAKIRAAAFMTVRWGMLCFAIPVMATSDDNKVRARTTSVQTILWLTGAGDPKDR